MKLTVQLLTWNGEKYIPYLFDSLRAQTFTDWKLNILDNNSTDNTVEMIKKELNNFNVQHELMVNKENVGFAGGHNRLLKRSDSEYVLFLNQDIYLDKDCLKNLVDFLDNNDCAGVSPRIMKWNFPDSCANGIDSLGLEVYKNRQVVDFICKSKCANVMEVFGISGAIPMFRLTSIMGVSFSDGSLFDETYDSYKEDVDLAFRLQSVGYKVYTILSALAYHDRSGSAGSSVLKNKKMQPAHIKYNSYKNHLMTLYKNEYWQNFILDFPYILWYELKKFIWFLLFDREVLNGLKDIWNNRAELKNKRNEIKTKRRLNWSQMRKRMYL